MDLQVSCGDCLSIDLKNRYDQRCLLPTGFIPLWSYVLNTDGNWQKIHAQEFPLQSGMQIKFGSEQGQILEFRIDSHRDEL